MASGTHDWASKSIEELEEAVRYHNKKYWIDNAPEISDPEFDRLVEALRDKEPNSPVLDAIGPAGAGDASEDEDTVKIAHDPPMLSLGKCYDEETLLKWFDKFEGDAVVSPKIDGVAVCIKYDEAGELIQGATRGDGTVGELITDNVRQIVDVPTKLNVGPIEVRGEAYIPLDTFKERFGDEYMSPRNLTAGALKRKDGERTADYGVHFFCYDILGVEFSSETAKMAFAAELGFTPVPTDQVEHDALQSTYDQLAGERHLWNYETDGIVYKVNDTATQEEMGRTSHHPRFALAYKFQGESGSSTLREIEWSVSRTGAINPVAIVDPIELSGAMVSRASLHNLAIMEQLGGEDGLRIGSTVMMMRRGGVIPNVEAVLEPGDEPVEVPEECPICGAKTYRHGDFLFAEHTDECGVYVVRQLEHFAKAMEIKGFGKKILEQVVDEGLVTRAIDFYALEASQLLPLERMGEKLANKLIDQIDQSREVAAHVFLRALGIDELGKHVSKILAREYDSMEEVFAVTSDELAEIHTIGEVIAQRVTEGLAARREEIEALLEEITVTFPVTAGDGEDEELPDTALAGKRVLFTGTLESMTRKEAQARVLEAGGETPSSVSRTLDYLVIGDADLERFNAGWRSSKLKKAEKYNAEHDEADIKIIGESEFLALLEQ